MDGRTWEKVERAIIKLPAGLRLARLIRTIAAELMFPQSCPPGHFYSPIPDKNEVIQDAAKIFGRDCGSVCEIDLRETEQLATFQRLAQRLLHCELAQREDRFNLDNVYLPAADAFLLAGILLDSRPRRYTEIGSGYSSALVLDIRDRYLPAGLECTFIEPNPERLKSLLRPNDLQSVQIINKRVQDIDDETFVKLDSGDILFVDGSHVAKIGSDLNEVLFRILPLLRPGVLIHFHDILWPFQYRREDVLRGRSWNEAYFLRAFLANNDHYLIYLFGSWLEHCLPDEWFSAFPEARGTIASSLWILKQQTCR